MTIRNGKLMGTVKKMEYAGDGTIFGDRADSQQQDKNAVFDSSATMKT